MQHQHTQWSFDVNSSTKVFLARAIRSMVAALKFCLYVALLLVGRVFLPIANVAIAVGIILFLFCAVVRPDLRIPMWAGAGLAVSATVASVFYDAALRLVAPDGTVVVRDV